MERGFEHIQAKKAVEVENNAEKEKERILLEAVSDKVAAVYELIGPSINKRKLRIQNIPNLGEFTDFILELEESALGAPGNDKKIRRMLISLSSELSPQQATEILHTPSDQPWKFEQKDIQLTSYYDTKTHEQHDQRFESNRTQLSPLDESIMHNNHRNAPLITLEKIPVVLDAILAHLEIHRARYNEQNNAMNS